MFKKREPPETIKILIVQDTWIQGQPVFAGEVVEVEKEILALLKETKRAVEYSKATKKQLELEKTFNAANRKSPRG